MVKYNNFVELIDIYNGISYTEHYIKQGTWNIPIEWIVVLLGTVS